MDLEEFKRSLWDLARLLRPSELPAVTQKFARHLPAPNVRVQSYEELFDLLLQGKAISPENVSLLSTALGEDTAFLYFRETLQQSHTRKTKTSRAFNILTFNSRKHSNTRMNAEFKELLCRIGTQLNKDDLSTLKFLCKDVISRRQLDTASSSLDLLTCLRKKRCITARSPEFLRRILQDADRLDLSILVENYMRSHQPKSRNSEFLDYQSSRQYQFHTSLKQLADKLGSADLQSLKVACRFYVPESMLEKVKTTCELFGLLEEKGKVSIEDLSFLEEILKDKLHLVHELYEKGFGWTSCGADSNCKHSGSSPPRNPANVIRVVNSESLELGYNRLLRTIGPRLTAYDVQQMKFLHVEDTGVESAEPITTGLDLLVLMEKRKLISPYSVQLLQNSLEHIGRKDLATVVALYMASNKEDAKQKEPDNSEGKSQKDRCMHALDHNACMLTTTPHVCTLQHTGTHTPGDSYNPIAGRDPLIMERDNENQSKEGQRVTKPEQADLARHAQARCELLEKLLEKEEECSQLLRDKLWLKEQVYELKSQLSFQSKVLEELNGMRGAESTVVRTHAHTIYGQHLSQVE